MILLTLKWKAEDRSEILGLTRALRIFTGRDDWRSEVSWVCWFTEINFKIWCVTRQTKVRQVSPALNESKGNSILIDAPAPKSEGQYCQVNDLVGCVSCSHFSFWRVTFFSINRRLMQNYSVGTVIFSRRSPNQVRLDLLHLMKLSWPCIQAEPKTKLSTAGCTYQSVPHFSPLHLHVESMVCWWCAQNSWLCWNF